MEHILLLSTSLALLLIAAYFALRLIPVTGRRVVWISMATALVLICVHRAITLSNLLAADAVSDDVPISEYMEPAILILILIALLAIEPIFRAAQRTSQLEDRFGRILNSSLHEIYLFHARTLKFTDMNRGALANLGYSRQELVEMTPVDLKPGFDLDVFAELIEPLLNGDVERVQFSTRHQRKDGSEYPVDVDLQISRVNDEPTFVAVIQDVSGKTDAERALAERDAHFRALIENVQDIITEIDEGNRIVYHSPSIRDILGYSSELIGSDALENIHIDDRELVSTSLLQIRVSESPVSFTYRMRHLDGSWRTLEGVGSMHRSAQSGHHIVINQRDITNRILAESRLIQSQKLETIGTLAGGIAHDFNNILTPILGYAGMLKDEIKDGEHHEYIDEIILAGHRAQELIRQILTYSRRSGHVRHPVCFPDIVGEAMRLLRASIPATVELQTHIDAGGADGAIVLADVTQIHQVIMNLCTNAYQAMQPDGGVLAVTVEHREINQANIKSEAQLNAGNYVVLTVRDSGHGMDKKTLDRMFEPFFTTKGAAEGTGLGLSVAHGIVLDHGGVLTATSEPGIGTTFYAWFPCVDQLPELPVVEPKFSSSGGHERILLVEDEQAVADYLVAMLRRQGYHVTSTADPKAALALVRSSSERIDLILTDQTMPTMTGLQLAAAIRQFHKDIHIIVMSGYSQDLTTEKTEPLRIHGVLTKPFAAAELESVIRSAFESGSH